MNRFKRPLQVNGYLLGGLLLLVLLSGGFQKSGEVALVLGTFMLLLAPVNFVVGMVRNRNKKPDGTAFILMAGLLLLVGFSTCGLGLTYGNINFH